MIKIFTREVFLFTLLFCFLNTMGQTWINTYHYDVTSFSGVRHDTLAIGPIEFCKKTDGKILSLLRFDPTETNQLVTIDSLGNFIGGINVSQSGGIYRESAWGLKPTFDNGYVLITDHIGTYNYTTTYKSGLTGNWIKTDNYPNPVTAITPSFYNTCFIQYYPDSLVEVDANGVFIRSRQPFNGYIATITDSDLFVFTNTEITRQDFNGTIRWSNLSGGYKPFFSDTNIIYCEKGSEILKLRTDNGNTIWTKNILHSEISNTHDGGLIVSYGNQIQRYDSSSNIVWSRTISFPEYGYKSIIEMWPNYYLTGGSFKSELVPTNNICHSSFLTLLDSSGHGVIDSTNHYYIGNANDNFTISFADDGAFIGAAMGSTGISRPVELQNLPPAAVFCTDWTDRFCNGINYKFSDYDGNGVIDTSDVINLSSYPLPLGSVTPHWRLNSSNHTGPSVNLIIAEDSIITGDSITIYITAGSSLYPIDSIYSISFTIVDTHIGDWLSSTYSISNNNFGNIGVNLFNYVSPPAPVVKNVLLSRNDHTNANLHGDTLCKFRLLPKAGSNGVWSPILFLNAISVCGYELNLNKEIDSVVMNSPTLNVSAISDKNITVYPNPSNQYCKIVSYEKINDLTVYNILGDVVDKKDILEQQYILDTGKYPDGIYFLKCTSGNKSNTTKISVIH
jgi:hypothetical protein